MNNNEFLPLPDNPGCYEELKDSNCYFVDKTEHLKTVFTSSTKVQLFTRPRRFGKTLLMTMFESFLQINPEKPFDTSVQQKYFQGTKILEDKEFCDKFMGQYPVISISLKDVTGKTFEIAYKNFAKEISKLAEKYRYLLNSPKLDKEDKDKLSKILKVEFLREFENSDYLTGSLSIIATALYKEYGKYPILLIDEYDVPLANASYHDIQNTKLYRDEKDFKADFHYNMVDLMKSFLGILKDQKTLTKVIITGCLKVAKNSLFTGVNNLKVNTVLSENEDYTGIIGFTKEETYKFLKDYKMDNFAQKVKEHYDGYKFYDKEMFCPWDIVSFISDYYKKNLKGTLKLNRLENYWEGTTSDKSLSGYLGYLTDNDNQKMQNLVDGKSVNFILNESMNYDTLSEHNSDDFWSLLLHTGYLTLDWDKTKKEELSKDSKTNKEVFARIPNLEILECFEHNIQNRFNTEIVPNTVADEIANALLNGDSTFAQLKLRTILMNFISLRDNATKAPHENYYHGYLNGLFTNCSENFFSEYHSNFEAGDGYADIAFTDTFSEKAAIIEIKTTTVVSDLIDLSQEAVEQIEEKHYADPFKANKMVQSIYAYGIAFAGKNCFITCKKLK
uniref:AAA family ATPase n=1 Tax=Succinivibrio sp. TaxID=2053619 RepID=UPI00402AEF2F